MYIRIRLRKAPLVLVKLCLSAFFLCTISCVLETSVSRGEEELSSKAPVSAFSYMGCTSGKALSTTSIEVEFVFPEEATEISIERDGVEVASFTRKSISKHIDDKDLKEGRSYIYTCYAKFIGESIYVKGDSELTLSTLAINAPNFNGIGSLGPVAEKPSFVRVEWQPLSSSIVDAYEFKIYSNPGLVIDEDIGPKAILKSGDSDLVFDSVLGVFYYNLGVYGDEVTYIFSVRACAISGICDNNVSVETIALEDRFPPQTTGASEVVVENGNVFIKAPWEDIQGGVKFRHICYKTSVDTHYSLFLSVDVLADYDVPEQIHFTAVTENTSYSFFVVDEDLSGNRRGGGSREDNCSDPDINSIVSLTTGDLTAPKFGGITNISHGVPADSIIEVNWVPIAGASLGPEVVSEYLIYLQQSAEPILTNTCKDGDLLAAFSAQDYNGVSVASHLISNLQERTYYKVCILAKDASNNFSKNTNALQINTLDITPPIFNGIQGVSFNNQTAEVDLSWNQSSSSDVKSYRVSLWLNQPAKPAASTLLTFSHENNPTGANITQSEFLVSDNDTIYALVEACDNTEAPFGTRNCSESGVIRSTQIPDVTPPQNFPGIRGAEHQVVSVEGAITVNWHEPNAAGWADVSGFRIYFVNPLDNSLMEVKTCSCSAPDCPERIVSCEVTNLDAYRTYRLHVRAYDAEGNETVYLDPRLNFADKQTLDITNPGFTSALTIGGEPDFRLQWAAASDNQYYQEPSAEIRYEVYRKSGSSFADPFSPEDDGNLRADTDSLFYADKNLVEGETYYFTVCAKDASGNRVCDGTVNGFTAPDLTKPVIDMVATNKTDNLKIWNLSWSMSDNSKSEEPLGVTLYRKVSDVVELASRSDENLGALVPGSTSVVGLTGPRNQKKVVNYLIVVRDFSGNETEGYMSVVSDNIVTVSSVAKNRGPSVGEKLVVIYGTGFSKGDENGYSQSTNFRIGAQGCGGISVINSTTATCITAPGIDGPSFVRAENPDGSHGILSDGYTYEDSPDTSPENICNRPSAWGADFAAGLGTETDPYIVCTLEQLDRMRYDVSEGAVQNYRRGNFYYSLEDNINLDGEVFLPISYYPNRNPDGTFTGEFTANYFSGSLDGGNHVVANWTYSDSTKDDISLLGYVKGSFTIKNIGVVGANLSGKSKVAGLVSLAFADTGSIGSIENVFVSGTITAASVYSGGVLGRKGGAFQSFSLTNARFDGEINGGNSVGGIVGYVDDSPNDILNNLSSAGSLRGNNDLGGVVGAIAGNATVGQLSSVMEVRGEERSTVGGFTVITPKGSRIGGVIGSLGESAPAHTLHYKGSLVTGEQSVGGLVGLSKSNIANSFAIGDVIASKEKAGGLVGESKKSELSDVYATGNVIAKGDAGGLIGHATNLTLSRSYATGSVFSRTPAVTAGDPDTVGGANSGGLIGSLIYSDYIVYSNDPTPVEVNREVISGTISRSHATGSVTGASSSSGGLIGNISTTGQGSLTMERVFSQSEVGDSVGTGTQFGGLLGTINAGSESTIVLDNCYAVGTISSASYSGGLIGYLSNSAGDVQIQKCYAAGLVQGTAIRRGGFFGSSVAGIGVSASYWDVDASTMAVATGDGTFTGTLVGYTTAEMQDQTQLIYDTWDFSSLWEWTETSGIYPTLVP